MPNEGIKQMSDDHPFIARLQHALGEDAGVGHVVSRQFATYSPIERRELIRKTEDLISSGESEANLRQRAQLMQFNRGLREIDTALRKANR